MVTAVPRAFFYTPQQGEYDSSWLPIAASMWLSFLSPRTSDSLSPSVYLPFLSFFPVSNTYHLLHSSLIIKNFNTWYIGSLSISTQNPGLLPLNFSFPVFSFFPFQPPTSILLLRNLLAEAAPFPKSPIQTANSPKVTLYSPSSSTQVPLLQCFIKPEFPYWSLSILSIN